MVVAGLYVGSNVAIWGGGEAVAYGTLRALIQYVCLAGLLCFAMVPLCVVVHHSLIYFFLCALVCQLFL